ncbi:putative Ig domain-containing protein [Plesiomonas shigelloides]|uniref:putative Ig domain-containing protein n=1 Tax=Plesiomonas shigelloides TaxID=703 RepID=UPI001E478694|nr:putative Ig domain-containing protein [Plesiomonas shigelloides]
MDRLSQKILSRLWLSIQLISGVLLLLLSFAFSASAEEITVTISPASGTTLAEITLGQPISIQFSATGGGEPFEYWQCDFTSPDYDGEEVCLPPGLSIGMRSGLMSGTITAPGDYVFKVSAVENSGIAGVGTYRIVVTGPSSPSITNISPTSGSSTGGTSVTLTGTNFTGATRVRFGDTAAAGYTVDSQTQITATTPVHSAGSVSVSVTTPSGTATQTNGFTYVAPPTLSLTPSTLSAGTVSAAYSATISASSGTAPYSYAVTAGSLPDGLILNPSTGELSGTPTADGTSNFTITATDANSATGARAYSLVIGVQPVTANAVTTTVAANSSANTITLNLNGGAATSVAVATNASHGTATASGTSITYTPTAGYSGSDSFTYTATNAAGIHCSNGLYHRYCTNSEPDTIDSVCGTVAAAYSATISASSGTAPYSYAVTLGAT